MANVNYQTKKNLILKGLFVIVAGFLVSACGGGSSTSSAPAASSSLTVTSAASSVQVNNTLQFTASGGTAPYVYTISSGGGSIDSSTGLYTAPSLATSVTVTVTDSARTTANLTVSVSTSVVTSTTLTISASADTIDTGETVQFSTTGGTEPYVYSIVSGGGSITSTGLYTASASTGSVEIKVRDADANIAYYTITIARAAVTGQAYCQGLFNMNVAGTSATLSLIEDANTGKVAGYYKIGSVSHPVTGTCALSLSGTVTINQIDSTRVFTGQLFVNSNNTNQIVMSGTFRDKPKAAVKTWMATSN